ncbi:hypothetical protein [Jiulongibacter sediminis]|uniref:Uncharacterized protein n=1 Tax=Jiulongibacter sediminis TaxID=1605367 RepID=A0A0P7C3N6_9BACT|nr:hypothetical protein [Jiulongibacter sediminis]KPM47742.1 hypothetical protein AFM12_10720 [Jiulongibacter sediminis]TBX23925.1 hypothetical protein TK44_10725 [Jiulongibacter sediminis]
MEKDNVFDLNPNDRFERSDRVKKQLVSEIDIIRDTMVMANMFMGEPFRIGMKLLEELQPSKPLTPNE